MPKNLLEVYDVFYQKLSILNDNTAGCAKNIVEDFRENEIGSLTFNLPIASNKWQYVVNENLVKWKNEYYVIKNTNLAHSKDKKMITVQCRHFPIGLTTIIRDEVVDIGYNAEQLIKSQLGYVKNVDAEGAWDGTFQEDTNAYPTDTGWLFGGTDLDLAINRSVESKEQSVFANLARIAELYGASLVFESDYVDYVGNHKRVVSLKKNVLNRGTQIRVGKNLKSINLNYDTSEIVTVMYPFGDIDKDGIEVSILGALDSNGVEVTSNIIKNYSYYKAKYPTLTDTYIDAHPELFLHEMTWRVPEYKTPQELFDEAIKKMDIVSQPKVTCNVEGVDLSILPEYFISSPVLSETITIIDEDLGLVLEAKVNALTRDNDNPLTMRVSISNEVERNSMFKSLVNSAKNVEKVISPTQQIRGQYVMEETIDNAHIKNLDAIKINAGDIATERMSANVVEAVNSYTGTAKIDLAQIKSVEAGSAFIGVGAIGSAQIEKLSATKIDAGTMDITDITVQGTNGRLKIRGNRIQVFDEDANLLLFERVALGDVNGDGTAYGLRVRGADGTTFLIDENGVTQEGFTDGYNKVTDGSLDAKKIDIATVVTAINNGVTTINSAKVMLDDTTLNVVIGEIQQAQNDTTTAISNQSTEISSLSSAISLKAEKSELTTYDAKFTQYDTKMAELKTQADGVSITVSDMSTKVSENTTEIDTINAYFDFLASGLKIGRTNDPLNINISNSEMDFLDSGKVVAYINGQKMYITSLEVLSSLLVGVHKIEKYNDAITLIKWVGGGQ